MVDEWFGDKPSVSGGGKASLKPAQYRDGTGQTGGQQTWGLGINAPASTLGMEGMESALSDAQKRARGEGGPSLAEQQLRAGQDSALRGAVALAGQGQGGNIGGQQMAAANAGAGGLGAANQQAAMMRIQEQQIAQEQAASQAQALEAANLGQGALYQQGQLGLNQQNIDWQLGQSQLDLERKKYETERNLGWGKVAAGVVGSAVGAIAKSDERSKHSIGRGSASEKVGEIDSADFEYNPGEGIQGRNSGVVAQQVEQTSLGQQLVRNGPDGKKYIDGGQAGAVALAASSEQEQRLRALEDQVQQRNPEQGNFSAKGIDDAQYGRDLAMARKAYSDVATQKGTALDLASRDAERYAIPQDSYRGRNPELVGAQTVDPIPQPTLKERMQSAYDDVAHQFGFADDDEDDDRPFEHGRDNKPLPNRVSSPKLSGKQSLSWDESQ